jgi:hypothetical protein
MTTYTVQKNEHKFKPGIFKMQTKPGQLDFEAVFDESCLYSPIDKEHDWNKLIGRAFDPVSPHNNSALVAWRSKGEGVIEIADYWHIGGGTLWAREAVLTLLSGEKLIGSIKHSYRSKRVVIELQKQGGEVHRRREQLQSMSCFTWILQPWFGGTWPAPNDMKLNLKYD